MRVLLSSLLLVALAGVAIADTETLRADANTAAAAGDTDKAIALMTELVEQAPDDGAARFPCEADERHHAFDFWIGKWAVTSGGQAAGTNNIQPILGHCVIFEQWESSSGGLGKSFNYYDPGYDHWRQIWISDSGTIIEFTGEARDGGIFYTSETVNPADGAITHHKFEFTQNDDGSVRQFWATSTDDKETWNTIWDGHYELQSEQ